MKTTLTFLALVTALCGQTADLSAVHKPIVTADYSSLLVGSGAAKADVAIATRYDIVWAADNTAGKLLSVNGITQIVPVPLQGNPNIWLTRQKAPEKPEEITVHVWTADGKKWKAKWEEVK